LTALAAEIDGCANVHFDAIETKGKSGDGIVFLHAVADGAASKSYGLQVARLAGLPAETVRQARNHLARLDQFSTQRDGQRDLFAVGETTSTSPAPRESALAAQLAALDPDALSPREALQKLYELKRLAGDAAAE